MKKHLILITIALAAMFTACSSSKNDDPKYDTRTITATSADWHYFSFANGNVGSGGENTESNDEWFARTDWDFAIGHYFIRTNSGDATTAGAQGGIYECDADVKFGSLSKVPSDAVFAEDEENYKEIMLYTPFTAIHSGYQSVIFDIDPSQMPPRFKKPNIYIIRTADGEKYYKVEFYSFKTATLMSSYGTTKFYVEEISL